jgi:L-alanine-DL-glutamate epimerase-like enolase superfamily enzyme
VPAGFRLADGRFTVPTGPGLGIEIDEAAVKKYARPRG